MSDIPTIDIDMDKRCRKCGRKGATPSGYCLKCLIPELRKRIARGVNKKEA